MTQKYFLYYDRRLQLTAKGNLHKEVVRSFPVMKFHRSNPKSGNQRITFVAINANTHLDFGEEPLKYYKIGLCRGCWVIR